MASSAVRTTGALAASAGGVCRAYASSSAPLSRGWSSRSIQSPSAAIAPTGPPRCANSRPMRSLPRRSSAPPAPSALTLRRACASTIVPRTSPFSTGTGGSVKAQGSPRVIERRRPRVVVEDLPRPLDRRQREGLRLDLVAAVLDASAPALLVGEQGGRDRSGQRGQQHRQQHGGPARAGAAAGARAQTAATAAARAPAGARRAQRSASHRSIRSPPASVSSTRTPRGTSASPRIGQRSRQLPSAPR